MRSLGPAILTGTGLWRYAPVLPIADPAHRVTLGEGGTPLLDAPRLARDLGVRRLLVKFEGSNPTGTVKDRSSATAVSARSEEHTSELQSRFDLVCRLLLEKKKLARSRALALLALRNAEAAPIPAITD